MGAMYWRWGVNFYEEEMPGNYGAAGLGMGCRFFTCLQLGGPLNASPASAPAPAGVLPGHSTFDLITAHSRRMKARMNSHPPKQDCAATSGCWVPATSLFGMLRR